jgi:hypothetical protein
MNFCNLIDNFSNIRLDFYFYKLIFYINFMILFYKNTSNNVFLNFNYNLLKIIKIVLNKNFNL